MALRYAVYMMLFLLQSEALEILPQFDNKELNSLDQIKIISKKKSIKIINKLYNKFSNESF